MKRLLSEWIVFMPVCSSPSSSPLSKAMLIAPLEAVLIPVMMMAWTDGRATVGKVWALQIAAVVVARPPTCAVARARARVFT